MAALCTFVVVVMNCSAVSDVWIRLSVRSSAGLLMFLVPAQVPVSQLLLIYDDYPRSCLPCFLVPPCLLDRLVSWRPLMYCGRCTVCADVLSSRASDVAC